MSALTGRTALVTVASRGIGRGIAERLGRDGARVAVHYGRNQAAARETAAAIEAAGGSAFTIGAELGRPGDAQALREEFDRHADGLDIRGTTRKSAPHGRSRRSPSLNTTGSSR